MPVFLQKSNHAIYIIEIKYCYNADNDFFFEEKYVVSSIAPLFKLLCIKLVLRKYLSLFS